MWHKPWIEVIRRWAWERILCVKKGYQRHGLGCRKACSSQSNSITSSVRLNLGPDTALLTAEPKFTVGATVATKRKKHASAAFHYVTKQFSMHNIFSAFAKVFCWMGKENLSEAFLTVGFVTIKPLKST